MNQALEKKIQEMYASVPEHIREDMVEAAIWARDTLMRHEGAGHLIHVTAHHANATVVCSFAKPEWAGDHCGRECEEAAEAIVIAVCEYLCGA